MHLKRVNTPTRWNLAKKTHVFVTTPSAGPHSKEFSIPLIVLLRDELKLVKTKKECKDLLNSGKVFIDGSIVKDAKRPVGLFDAVSLPEYNMYYRIMLDYKGGIKPLVIDKEDAKTKLFKIMDKRRLKGGKIQLNCTSGRNILVEKNSYENGDTIIFDLASKKIVKHLPFKEGSHVLLTHGKHAGETAIIAGFKEIKGVEPNRVVLKGKNGVQYETSEGYAFIIGKELGEKK